ncbi:MAG: D-alanyl-D-alanine carboxypeptidase family protein [Micropruina sp.]|uniref:M15 family metallopeptidase n=1 Tax=Micropruina sp. TaxID=2737536 RepID=UPI0039E5DDC4
MPSSPAHPSAIRWAAAAGAILALAGCSATAPVAQTQSPVATPAQPSVTLAQPSVTLAQPSTTSSRTPTATATSKPSPTKTSTAPPTDRRTAAQRNRPFTVKGIPVVSKKHPINASYRRSSVTSPYGLTQETQLALTRMIVAARAKGVRLLVRSGYRSYSLQAQILSSKIREYGSETLARRYNAAPGRSEHQTGLAVDLWDGVTWGVGVRATKAGKWLWANAWRYGFILRYPNGKEKITGYAFEPWHYRYIGTKAAKAFGANSNLTLEEYLGIA